MNAPLPLPPDDYEPQDSDEQALHDALHAQWAKEAAMDALADGQLPQVDLSLEKLDSGDFAVIPMQNGVPIQNPTPVVQKSIGPTGSRLFMPLYAGGGGFGNQSVSDILGTDSGTGTFGGTPLSSTQLVIGSQSSTALTNVTAQTQITHFGGNANITISNGSVYSVAVGSVPTRIGPGVAFDLELPDGGKLKVAKDGSYTVEDKDAKITYRASRVRDFNPYLNASDMLGEFIEDLAKLTPIREDQALKVPIEVFINWLIMRAAKADGVEPPADLKPLSQVALVPPSMQPPPPKQWTPIRCGHCGRYVSRKKASIGLRFCNGHHADQYLAKTACSTP